MFYRATRYRRSSTLSRCDAEHPPARANTQRTSTSSIYNPVHAGTGAHTPRGRRVGVEPTRTGTWTWHGTWSRGPLTIRYKRSRGRARPDAPRRRHQRPISSVVAPCSRCGLCVVRRDAHDRRHGPLDVDVERITDRLNVDYRLSFCLESNQKELNRVMRGPIGGWGEGEEESGAPCRPVRLVGRHSRHSAQRDSAERPV